MDITVTVQLSGLIPLTATWTLIHDEAVNWFWSVGCDLLKYPLCCGQWCGTGFCRTCAQTYPSFCPYGGDPCAGGCADAFGIASPLQQTWTGLRTVPREQPAHLHASIM